MQEITSANGEHNGRIKKVSRCGFRVWQAWVTDAKSNEVHLVLETVCLRTLVRLLQGEGFFKPA